MKLEPKFVWVGLVVGLLGMSVVIQMTGLWLANSDPSFAVVEDYERKARDWDQTQLEQARSAALGWAATLTTAPLQRGARVRLELTDAAGAPVDGATATVVAFHNARAADRTHSQLIPLGGGSYAAALPLDRSGLWEFELDVVRADERFTQTFRKSVALGARQ